MKDPEITHPGSFASAKENPGPADLIDKEECRSIPKGDVYDGPLQKNADDVKGGVGEYFTPRALSRAVVDVMQPQPDEGGQPFTICDSACGTGGFSLAAHDFIRNHNKLDKKQLTFRTRSSYAAWY